MATRKVTKKTAAKKAAKKVTKNEKSNTEEVTTESKVRRRRPAPKMLSGRNILDDPDYASNVMAGLDAISAKYKKRPVRYTAPDDMYATFIPIADPQLCRILNLPGVPTPSIFEIIGPTGLGKTTLAMDIAGTGMRKVGCPVVFMECEGKSQLREHVERMLSADKDEAYEMYGKIQWLKVREQGEMHDTLVKTVKVIRNQGKVTMDVPIIVIVDPYGKLMSTSAAEGRTDWDVGEAALKKGQEAKKEIGGGSTQEFAKWTHAWMSVMPTILEKYNILLIIVNHQNDDVVMNMMSRPKAAKKNDTTRGGRAVEQNSGIRLTMTAMQDEVNTAKQVVGRNVRLYTLKNSYGPRARECEIMLRTDDYVDTEDSYDRPWSNEHNLAKYMVEHNILGMKLNMKRVTCDAFKLTAASLQQFKLTLEQHPEYLELIKKEFRVMGYVDTE